LVFLRKPASAEPPIDSNSQSAVRCLEALGRYRVSQCVAGRPNPLRQPTQANKDAESAWWSAAASWQGRFVTYRANARREAIRQLAELRNAVPGELRRLEAALVAYRHVEGGGRGGRTSNNGVAARCGCGRRIRVAESVLSAGPITCGLCGSDFAAAAS